MGLSRVELFERIRRGRRVDSQVPVRTLARRYGVHRRTVRQALDVAVLPERRRLPRRRSLLEPAMGWVEAMLREDLTAPPKQRHTTRRVFQRLATEYGFSLASYSTLCAYVKVRRAEIAAEARDSARVQPG